MAVEHPRVVAVVGTTDHLPLPATCVTSPLPRPTFRIFRAARAGVDMAGGYLATLDTRQDNRSYRSLEVFGGALSAVQAQCNYLGVWPY